MNLEFDSIAHKYKLNGADVPSVTQVLDQLTDFSGIPAAVLDHAKHRGIAVHKACELDDLGDLVEESVHSEIHPYLEAYRKFKNDTGFEVLLNESQVGSELYGYAGTLDRVGELNQKKCLVDLKATASISAVTQIQTAGYARAVTETHGVEIEARYVLQLKPDGTYRLVEHTNPNNWGNFLSCLNLYLWRQENVK